ncbi:MAG: hypothetical protein ACFCVK_24160 [Acidimicrobiales bacterium]
MRAVSPRAPQPPPASAVERTGTTGTVLARAAAAPLAAHVVAYLLLLVAITAVVPVGGSFGTDDGAYGGQVHALRRGSWTVDRPLPVVDEANEGWLNAAITPDGPLPYTTNPAYPLLLTTTARLVDAVTGSPPPVTAGDDAVALAALPVLGAVAAAVAAWLLARRLDPRASALAFWLVAVGPTLVNATTLWAHTLATAAAGFAVYAVAGLVDPVDRVGPGDRTGTDGAATGDGGDGGTHRSLPLVAVALAACVGAVAVRTESIFFVAALGIATLVVDRRPRVVATIATVSAVAGAIWLGNRAWGAAMRADRLPIATSVIELSEPPGWLAGRLPAAWALLGTTGDGLGPTLALTAVALVVHAAVGLRRPHPPASAGLQRSSLTAAVVLLSSYIVIGGGAPLSGLVAAWPVGIVLLAPRGPGGGQSLPRLLGVTSTVFAAAIVLTQYSSSGGLQWGGRYLSMALVPLAVLAAVRGRTLVARWPGVVLALLVVPAVAGVATTYRLHANHAAAVEAVTAAGSEVVVTESPAVPRIAWTALPATVYRADGDTLGPLLAELAAAGVDTVTVHGIDDTGIEPATGYRVGSTSESLRHLERMAAAGP